MDGALAAVKHAMQTTVTTALHSTPGDLAFSRDIFLNVPLVTNWQTISSRREHHVDKKLRKVNDKQWSFNYDIGQEVVTKVHKNVTKLGVITSGPYPIHRVHMNGNLTLELRPGLLEQINTRRLLLYYLNPTSPTWSNTYMLVPIRPCS